MQHECELICVDDDITNSRQVQLEVGQIIQIACPIKYDWVVLDYKYVI